MSRIVCCLIAIQIIFCASAEAQSWQYTNGPYTDSTNSKKVDDVIGFSRPNESRLFAASRSNGVFRTDNRGDNWQQCWFSGRDSVTSLVARGSIVLIGTYKGLVRSIDSGNHFDSLQNLYYRPFISQIVCDKNNVFYAIAADDRNNDNIGCFCSNDSGSTWTFLTSTPAGLAPESLEIDSANQLLFIGYPPPNDPNLVSMEVWKSGDSGNTWSRTQSPYFLENAYFFAAAPNGDFYAEATIDALLRANDSAYDSWGPVTPPSSSPDNWVRQFAFLTGDHFFVTTGDSLYYTTDHANTWTGVGVPLSEFPVMEFAFGGDLYLSSEGVVRLSLDQSSVASAVSPQNTSNFFFSSGALFIEQKEQPDVHVSVFDEAGRLVALLSNPIAKLGMTRFILPATLHAGIYFACCNSQSGYLTCKFVIEQ